MKQYKIAAIPGDGIGKEVIAEGVKVLNTLARQSQRFKFSFRQFPGSSDYFEAVTAKRVFTPDLGGTARTAAVTRAVCDFLRQ